MPAGPIAPRSLAGLLAEFRPCFTAPTFQTFIGLVVGLIAQTRRRTVCGMLTGAGLEQVWHHSRAHRLFTNARWSSDALGLALADLIVTHLLPAGSPLTVAVDDTLFKRSGKKVFGVAWHHDGAAKGPKPIGFGNCWVVAGIVVQLSFLSRPVCLPVLARLWRPRHTGKIAHARELAELIAARYPDRAVHVVGDAAYVGERLRDVAGRITWTSRLKVTSVLHELPPPRTGRSGRPRTRGARLGTPADVAALATTTWRATQVRRYGRTDTVQITERVCLWYGSFRSRTVRVILVRDDKPQTRDRDDRGYGLPLVTRVSQFCGVLPGPVGRGDAPGMARSVILGCEEESIDGSCTTLVRVIRRCFPAPPYRPRWPVSWPCSGRALPLRPSRRSSGWLLV